MKGQSAVISRAGADTAFSQRKREREGQGALTGPAPFDSEAT
jgi:sec-independent protein translocase protein TatB